MRCDKSVWSGCFLIYVADCEYLLLFTRSAVSLRFGFVISLILVLQFFFQISSFNYFRIYDRKNEWKATYLMTFLRITTELPTLIRKLRNGYLTHFHEKHRNKWKYVVILNTHWFPSKIKRSLSCPWLDLPGTSENPLPAVTVTFIAQLLWSQ